MDPKVSATLRTFFAGTVFSLGLIMSGLRAAHRPTGLVPMTDDAPGCAGGEERARR